jgi:hypothetical protein
MKSDISVALKSFLGRGENKMAVDRKRGRPKGTGINDHEMLLKIAHLLVAEPTKKRTTAIKEIGVTNASVVRRLRDKYQEEEASLLAEVHAASAPAAAVAAPKTSRKAAAAAAAIVAAAPAVVETAAPVVAQAVNGHAARAAKTTKKGKVAATKAAAHVAVEAAAPVQAVAAAAPVAAPAPAATTAQVQVEPIAAARQAAPAAAQAQAAPTAPAGASASAQAAKPALDPLAALFEGLNIETLVTQFIGHALGLSPAEIKNSPIPALIRQQAQLADLVLPLLAGQFMGQRASKAA